MEPITIGSKGTASVKVDETNLALTVGSGSLPVFATPMMAALMEEAACNAIAPFLSEGETTVGTKLDISHDAATPEGLTVTATAEISYHVTAEDGVGVIGSGTHKRFLVDADRFLNKAQKRGQ